MSRFGQATMPLGHQIHSVFRRPDLFMPLAVPQWHLSNGSVGATSSRGRFDHKVAVGAQDVIHEAAGGGVRVDSRLVISNSIANCNRIKDHVSGSVNVRILGVYRFVTPT